MEEQDTHLGWCKRRAIDALQRGTIHDAFRKFVADMEEHPDTRDHSGIEEGKRLLYGGGTVTERSMEQFINALA